MNLKRTSLVLVALLLVASITFAQSSEPKRKFKHRGKIETKYDKFKDQTSVRLNPYYVQGTAPKLDPTAGIEITASFVFKGQKLSAPTDSVFFGIVSASPDGFRYEKDRGLIALVDGERIDLGEMEREDASYKKYPYVISGRYYVERLSVPMKYDLFLKIANAKVVEMQAGKKEFKLKDEHLEALRDLASRMILKQREPQIFTPDDEMAADLSKHHEPISQLFQRRSSTDDWIQHRLTEDQIEFFHDNGYLAGIRVLTDDQVELLRGELAELADPAHPGHEFFYEFHSNESADPSTVLFHALGAWRISPGFHDLLWNPAFLMPASQLLGGAVRFWHDQLFCKPPHHGGVVAWHQDYSYWTRTQPMAHLSCWIGLDDSTRENGCVHYVPASHRWNLLPITGLANDMAAIQSVLAEAQQAQFKPVAIELKAGECSFHHPLMVHGSFQNRSNRPRRGTVINVFRDGVRSASNEPLLEGVPPIPAGEKIDGRFFPLLFDRSA